MIGLEDIVPCVVIFVIFLFHVNVGEVLQANKTIPSAISFTGAMCNSSNPGSNAMLRIYFG
jgi:hypothetical protein